jgi:hypothetical protein
MRADADPSLTRRMARCNILRALGGYVGSKPKSFWRVGFRPEGFIARCRSSRWLADAALARLLLLRLTCLAR